MIVVPATGQWLFSRDGVVLLDNVPEMPRGVRQGFLWFPPYRVVGYSVGGEATTIHVPELNLGFDIGVAPRYALNSDTIAISHGHMDHLASIAYYFSQRRFQGMNIGTVVCHPSLAKTIDDLMGVWRRIERQETEYNIIPMVPDDEPIQLRKDLLLGCFKTRHNQDSMGYIAYEKRTKLLPELVGMDQAQILKVKEAGKPVTYNQHFPLVVYTGDCANGPYFEREDVLKARIAIVECTFCEPGHKSRAKAGCHMHLNNLIPILERFESEAIVLNHLSRRTSLHIARELLDKELPASLKDRVYLLQDHRTNKSRYDKQVAEARQAG